MAERHGEAQQRHDAEDIAGDNQRRGRHCQPSTSEYEKASTAYGRRVPSSLRVVGFYGHASRAVVTSPACRHGVAMPTTWLITEYGRVSSWQRYMMDHGPQFSCILSIARYYCHLRTPIVPAKIPFCNKVALCSSFCAMSHLFCLFLPPRRRPQGGYDTCYADSYFRLSAFRQRIAIDFFGVFLHRVQPSRQRRVPSCLFHAYLLYLMPIYAAYKKLVPYTTIATVSTPIFGAMPPTRYLSFHPHFK